MPKPVARPLDGGHEGPKPMRNQAPPSGWPVPDSNSSYVIEIGSYKGLTVPQIPVSKQAYWAQCNAKAHTLVGDDKEKITRLMNELERAIKSGAV